jgi:hypothetical protein
MWLWKRRKRRSEGLRASATIAVATAAHASMSDDFTPAAYRALLTALLERGYEVRDYANADPQMRHLILRHDLDMSLEAALPIAEVENSLGAKAHYFVLLRTEMYNLFSARAREILLALRGLGHEIGLHLDASLYGNDTAQLQQASESECRVLEAASGAPVHVISFHRPAKALLGYPEKLAGRLHAYQPKFFTEMGYCSDSRGAWHYGAPREHAAVREGRALQLLTHPIWWVTDTKGNVTAKLDRFMVVRTELLREELARNCLPYGEALVGKFKP